MLGGSTSQRTDCSFFFTFHSFLLLPEDSWPASLFPSSHFFPSQPSPLYFSVFTPTWTSATPEGEVRVSRELNLTLGGLCFSSVCKGIFRLAVSEKPDRPHNVWGWVSISCEVESMRLKYIKASSPGTWVLILFQPLTNYLPLEGDLTFLGLSFLFGNLI